MLSPGLSLEFSCIVCNYNSMNYQSSYCELHSWWKNKSFWQRFTWTVRAWDNDSNNLDKLHERINFEKKRLKEDKIMTYPEMLVNILGNFDWFLIFFMGKSQIEGNTLELVSEELNHFWLIAGLFRQIRGHTGWIVLFALFEYFSN